MLNSSTNTPLGLMVGGVMIIAIFLLELKNIQLPLSTSSTRLPSFKTIAKIRSAQCIRIQHTNNNHFKKINNNKDN